MYLLPLDLVHFLLVPLGHIAPDQEFATLLLPCSSSLLGFVLVSRFQMGQPVSANIGEDLRGAEPRPTGSRIC